MTWKICKSCGDHVKFYAIDEASNREAYCWPCWISMDAKEEE